MPFLNVVENSAGEAIYHLTLRETEPNRDTVYKKRNELLVQGCPAYILITDAKPGDPGFGINRAQRRGKQRVFDSLMRKRR